MIWHTNDSSLYRIHYATSIDDGNNWVMQPDVFSSPYESYHPALAADDDFLYVAIPSRIGAGLPYQILFTRKPLAEGSWSPAGSLMGGSYNAVRPDLYLDPSNGRLHLIASSLDDAPYLYYRAYNTQDATWGNLSQFNPSNSSANTRYASIHANGDNIYVASRTVSNLIFFTYYYLNTARSTNGGLTWIDQTEISWYLAFTTGEYGVSLAGIGDRLYMGYEVGSNIYFRRYDGAGWSDYLQLETGDPENVYKWPTITQADDGQAWMMFEVNKELYMRHYDGSNWQAKEKIGQGTYANLKLGNGGGRVEWVNTICNGSPFDLEYGSYSLGPNSPPQAHGQNVSTDEDIPLDITLTGSDPEGNGLTFNVTAGPANGVLSGTPPNVVYTPAENFYGADSFDFIVNDGQVDSSPATVSITVNPINDPPLAGDDTGSVAEGGTLNEPPPGLLSMVSDPENDPLTVTTTPVTPPMYGALTLYTDGSYTYAHDGGETTSDSFVYEACDTGPLCDTATVDLTIIPVNDPPLANDDSVTTLEDTPVAITLTGSDAEGDGLTFSVVTGPDHGVLEGAVPDLSYTPNPGFSGSDCFTFVANDGQDDSNLATVSITVAPAATIVDAVASSEVFVAGTVTGNYSFTHAEDGDLEVITERESGGKPQNRYSHLEHKWIFSVTPGNVVTLYAKAWRGDASNEDNFIFAYSMNDAIYVEMFTVSNTSDAGYATYTLPASIQGTVYVRVSDSDHSPGNRTLDTVYMDHLYIRSEVQPGDPPAAPTNLSAEATGATSIDLAWTDNAGNGDGFQIERSPDGANWSQIDSVGADVTSYADTSVSPNTTYYYRVGGYNASGSSGYSNTASATTPDGLSLTASGYKVKGVQMADLTWSGGSATSFDVYRDGNPIASGVSGKPYTDNIGQKGGGSYLYQVCEAGSLTNCSNIVQVGF